MMDKKFTLSGQPGDVVFSYPNCQWHTITTSTFTEEPNVAALYEVAIIRKPTPNEEDEGAIPEIVMPPTPVVAVDEKSATVKAAQKCDTDFDAGRMEVLVRRFA